MPPKLPEINGIRVKENHLHIKQNKEYGHEEIFDRHWLPCIPAVCDAAFKVRKLIGGFSFWPEEMRQCHHTPDKDHCKKQLYTDGKIIDRAVYIG